MIRRLRRRHLLMISALAVILPVGLGAGLHARRPLMVTTRLPDGLADAPLLEGQTVFAGTVQLGPVPVTLRVVEDSTSSGGLVLILVPSSDLRRPDLLVYWSAETGALSAVPPDAVLLGKLAGTRPRQFRIPGQAVAEDGQLLVYSLGHREIVGSVPLPLRSWVAANREQ